MQIIELDDLSRPELAPFARLTEAQLRNRRDPEQGLFIAESPKVITCALDAGYEPVSFLMEKKHLTDKPAVSSAAAVMFPSLLPPAICWPN